jgi:hypothetical protein
VGSWHHHRFKSKVEIVGYCLENNEARNKIFGLALALGATHAALGAVVCGVVHVLHM